MANHGSGGRHGRTFPRAKTAAAAAARTTCFALASRTAVAIAFVSVACAWSVRSAVALPQDGADDDPVFSHAGRSCKCIPFFQCGSSDVVDIPSGDSGKTNPCHLADYQCCLVGSPKPIVIPTPDVDVVCGYGSVSDVIMPKITAAGSDALYGEFPWMAVIYKRMSTGDGQEKIYLCGASLIHPEVVLTAAHCVHGEDPEKLVVYAGDWDLENNNEPDPVQKAEVSKIITHKDYFGGGRFYNDIALVFITPAFLLNENVGVLCLPPQSYEFQTGKCYVSGWGQNTNGGDDLKQSVLKKIELPIVARDNCLLRLKLAGGLSKNFKLHASFICAGGKIGRDTCRGDGGSPLMCSTPDDSKQFYQAGIVSWGLNNCGTEIPGVYTDVSKFREWIDQKMIGQNLDASFYNYK